MVTAAPMAADLTAADGAGNDNEDARKSLGRSALRREQRRSTLRCLRSRLERRIADEAFGAAEGASDTDDARLAAELAHRLVLQAPALAAGLRGAVLAPLARRRRNAAAHCFDVAASDIAAADGSGLNRIQRGGRPGSTAGSAGADGGASSAVE